MIEYNLHQLLFDELGYSNSPELKAVEGKSIPGITQVYSVNNIQVAYFSQFEYVDQNRIWELHRAVWNESKCPLLYVILPTEIRIYNTYAVPSATPDELNTEERLLRHLNELVDVETARQKIYEELYLNHYDRVHIETGAFWESQDGRNVDKRNRADNRLLQAMDALRHKLLDQGLSSEIAYALLGRSIFIRYLEDRKALDRNLYWNGANDYLEMLQDVDATYRFFEDLTNRFGGDIFPILDEEKDAVSQEQLNLVADFLAGTDLATSQRSFWPFNFEYIPVELISGIYDTFLDTAQRRTAGTYYTPHTIVDFVLDETMPPSQVTASLKLLDPACGSGAFLVRAYQKLVHAWIKERHSQPSIKVLSEILSNNIYGVDTNQTAIRIAAFSLYLAALDFLDASTIAQGNFLFPNLYNQNLLVGDFFSKNIQDRLGRMSFDRIVGNPPWSSTLTKAASTWIAENNFTIGDRQIAQAFMLACPAFLAESGEIALLAPTKSTILVTSGPHTSFRQHFLENFSIRAIFNLSALRHEIFSGAVNPTTIFFYNGQQPNLQHQLAYVIPKPTSISQQIGNIVVENHDVNYLTPDRLIEFPHSWKIAAWGTPRDENLIERLLKFPKLVEIVEQNNFHMAEGIQVGGGDENPAPWLKGMNLVPTSQVRRYVLLEEDFEVITDTVFHRPRTEQITKGPLVLIRQSPIQQKCVAAFFQGNLAYRDKITGISGNREREDILKWLVLVINSPLSQYYHFMTSTSWAVERGNIIHHEYELMPISIPDRNDPRFLKAIDLFDKLVTYIETNTGLQRAKTLQRLGQLEKQISDLIFQVYDVYPAEQELVQDTIRYSIDFFYWGERSTRRPQSADSVSRPDIELLTAYAKVFTDAANTLLQFQGSGLNATIFQNGSPLTIVGFEKVPHQDKITTKLIHSPSDIRSLLARLDHLLIEQKSTSLFMRRQVRVYDGNWLYLIRPSEKRFWSKSRARADADAVIAEWLEQPSQAFVKETN